MTAIEQLSAILDNETIKTSLEEYIKKAYAVVTKNSIPSTRIQNEKVRFNKRNCVLGVCCALRMKPQKIALQAIFYLANSESMPINRDFCVTDGAKIHKCNRLLEVVESPYVCDLMSRKSIK
jgi:hypothetical protein